MKLPYTNVTIPRCCRYKSVVWTHVDVRHDPRMSAKCTNKHRATHIGNVSSSTGTGIAIP